MLRTFLNLAVDSAAEADLRREVAGFVGRLRASAGGGYRGQVARAEGCVKADPQQAFTFDESGRATLAVAGYSWQAGRFETPTLAELRQHLPAADGAAQARLWVLDGASPATDVGSLQATAESSRTSGSAAGSCSVSTVRGWWRCTVECRATGW